MVPFAAMGFSAFSFGVPVADGDGVDCREVVGRRLFTLVQFTLQSFCSSREPARLGKLGWFALVGFIGQSLLLVC